MDKVSWKEVVEVSRKHKELAMRATDYFSRPLTYMLVNYTKITPNQVSIISFLFILTSAYLFLKGGYNNILIGSFLAFVYNILDMIDGMIARLKKKSSLMGQWLDGILGYISFPIIIFTLAVGMRNYLALILGMLAIVSYPLQFLFVHYYKSDIQKNNEKINIPGKGKFEWTRYVYGASFFYFVLIFAAVVDKPIYILLFWATFGNLYWVAILFSQYKTLRKKKIME